MSRKKTAPGLFRYSEVQCAGCGLVSPAEQYYGLDLSQYPDGKAKLMEGKFFQLRCPKCGLETEYSYPCWYFDPKAKLGVALIPDINSAINDGKVQAMNQDLESLALPGMTHRAVGDFYAMQEAVRAHDAGLDLRVVQLAKPLIIGQLQSKGESVWNGFFQGVSTPEAGTEPVRAVLYAAMGPDKVPEYGRPVYWYDIHLTSQKIVHAGVNEVLFQMCQGLLEQAGAPPDDGKFHLYDLNWAIQFHNRIQQG